MNWAVVAESTTCVSNHEATPTDVLGRSGSTVMDGCLDQQIELVGHDPPQKSCWKKNEATSFDIARGEPGLMGSDASFCRELINITSKGEKL